MAEVEDIHPDHRTEFEILADAKEHGTDDPDLARQASVVTRL